MSSTTTATLRMSRPSSGGMLSSAASTRRPNVSSSTSTTCPSSPRSRCWCSLLHDDQVRTRIGPLQFVLWFGLVSALGDFVYEGARSIIGPYLAHLGASALAVGVVTGIGEAIALVLRLFTGRFADRTQRPWPQTILGYALTMICVPLIALSNGLASASVLYNGERFGKAVRAPSRDMMLAHAAAPLGRGRAFGLHEALDQSGALVGPLVIAVVLGAGGSYHLSFAMLAVPGAVALLVLFRLRAAAPHPEEFDPEAHLPESKQLRIDTH